MKAFDPGATAQFLKEQRGTPPEKAAAKVASLARGVVLLVLGVFLMLVAAALVGVPMFLLREIPGVAFLVFSGVFGGIGAFLLFVGGHIMSGEAMHAAAETGGIVAKTVAKTVQLVRGKTP